MSLVLEAPSSAVAVRSFTLEDWSSKGKEIAKVPALLVALKDRIVVLENRQDGNQRSEIFPTTGISGSGPSTITDCIYSQTQRSLVMATSDKSISLISMDAKNPGKFIEMIALWPVSVAQLIPVPCSKSVIVVGADGSCAQLSTIKRTTNSKSVKPFRRANSSVSTRHMGRTFHCVVSQDFLVTVECSEFLPSTTPEAGNHTLEDTTTSKRRRKSANSGTAQSSETRIGTNSTGSLSITLHSARLRADSNFAEPSAFFAWLSVSSTGGDCASTEHTVMINARESIDASSFTTKLEVVDVCGHSESNTVSLLLAETDSKGVRSGRWLRINSVTGDVVYDRDIPHAAAPISCIELTAEETGGDCTQFWVVLDNMTTVVWDLSYGILQKSLTFSGVGAVAARSVFSNKHSPHQGNISLPREHWLLPLWRSTQRSGRCSSFQVISAVGMQGGAATEDEGEDSAAVGIYRSVLRSASENDAPATAPPRCTLASALGRLRGVTPVTIAGPVAVANSEARRSDGSSAAELSPLMATLPLPSSRAILEMTQAKGKGNVAQRVIPHHVSKEFFSNLVRQQQQLTGADWEAVLALVRMHALVLAEHPQLLSCIAQHNRLDVLLEIAASAPDLTETQAVKILYFCMLIPDSALEKFSFIKGKILMRAEGPSTPASKKRKSESTDIPVVGADRISVLHVFSAVLLHRPSGFSSMLLGDSLRLISCEVSVVLLGVFAQHLRTVGGGSGGVSSRGINSSGSSGYALGGAGAETLTGDAAVCQAVVWIEAILDAHFSAIVLRATSHAPTRKALVSAVKAVRDTDVVSSELQAVLGSWFHISRVADGGSQPALPITSLYQMETLFI